MAGPECQWLLVLIDSRFAVSAITSQGQHHSGETGICMDGEKNNIVADVLDGCIAKTSVSMALAMSDGSGHKGAAVLLPGFAIKW